jgi:hypothetical protein
LVVEGAVKNVTVKQKGGRWFVSIQTEREVAEPVHPARTAVGIDLGGVGSGSSANFHSARPPPRAAAHQPKALLRDGN